MYPEQTLRKWRPHGYSNSTPQGRGESLAESRLFGSIWLRAAVLDVKTSATAPMTYAKVTGPHAGRSRARTPALARAVAPEA